MAEFLAMGGYAQFVWSAFGLSVVTLIYNVLAARRRMRVALEHATLNALRLQNRRRTEKGKDE